MTQNIIRRMLLLSEKISPKLAIKPIAMEKIYNRYSPISKLPWSCLILVEKEAATLKVVNHKIIKLADSTLPVIKKVNPTELTKTSKAKPIAFKMSILLFEIIFSSFVIFSI